MAKTPGKTATKKAAKTAAPETIVTEEATPKIELSEEFRAQEKMFLKSLVENPNTPHEVFAALSPWNLERVVQDAANNGETQSRRHNPSLASYLKKALQNEDFPAGVLAALLRKTSKGDYFRGLQNAALDHIEKFPHKAEEAFEFAARRRPERFEHDPEGVKRKRHTATKTHYALVDIKYEGEAVASPKVPTAATIKEARALAYVQFWNDYTADQVTETFVTRDASKPAFGITSFRHHLPLRLGKTTPKFNEQANMDLLALAIEKGYTLNYEQGPEVEINGQAGVTATFTLSGKWSKKRDFEFTVTRFGSDAKTADNLAAMAIMARYDNDKPALKAA